MTVAVPRARQSRCGLVRLHHKTEHSGASLSFLTNSRLAPRPTPDRMQGSTPLANFACSVRQQHDDEPEDKLLQALHEWRGGTSDDRRRLGDPHAIVLDTGTVRSLAARLRDAPWTRVATVAPEDDRHVRGVTSALQLLSTLLSIVHDSDAAAGSAALPSAHVMTSLLRQVHILTRPAESQNVIHGALDGVWFWGDDAKHWLA